MTKLKAPELLLPAGNLKHLEYAYDFGADAVYAGQPRYSLRARNNEFQFSALAQGISEARKRGKKLYVASNILPHNSKVKTYLRDMAPLMELKPDALIMADPGLIMLVKEAYPAVEIHLSVQANTLNFAAVKFWQQMGISRIILSRELSLDEIEEIRQECPDIGLEVFVHGSLCIAYSGRCLLSGYFNRRDPNQGTCTNACRWEYKVYNNTNSENSNCTSDENSEYLIEDVSRPNEFMPIEEDEHGTYIMNSKDLRAIMHIERLAKIGVDSLKIEGRTKSYYYVARVARAYRQAIDLAVNGQSFDPALLSELEGLANRGYTDGFLERHHHAEYQNYIDSHSKSRLSQYVGDVIGKDNDYGIIEVKNRFKVGDSLEVYYRGNKEIIQVTRMLGKDNQELLVANGSGVIVKLPGLVNMDGALLARIID